VTFIDSNIPMYLVGAPHPHKDHARRLLEEAVEAGERLVTDAEVFQEILHRYVAIDRRDAIGPAFEVLLGIADEIFPIEFSDVSRAREILLGYRMVSARDAIHIAAMERHGSLRILSFDSGFDEIPGIERVSR
jgi:uncharacterized protein